MNKHYIYRCEKDYGIFVPANKVMKAGKGYRPNPPEIKRQPKVSTVNFGKVRVSVREIMHCRTKLAWT